MCSPTAVAYGVTAVVAAYGAYSQHQANKQARQSQANADKYNARQRENEAEKVTQRGVEEENKQRELTRQLYSEQRAKQASSGLALDSGSFQQIQEQTVELGEVDALRIRSNYLDQATALREESRMLLGQASALEQPDRLAPVGILAAGAGAVASKWQPTKSSPAPVRDAKLAWSA